MELEELFAKHGVKPTANRLLIARALQQAGRPLSMTELEAQLETIDKSNVFRALTAFKDAHLVHVLVAFAVVEGAGVVQAGVEGVDEVIIVCPGAAAAKTAGEAFVVLTDVAGVGAGIEEIDAGIDGAALFSAPLKTLSHIDQLGGHVALETGPEVVPALDSLDLDEAAGEVSVLHGSDAAHHVHGFDVFRADGAHVRAQVHVIGAQTAPGGRVLQVGVVAKGLAVNGKLRSQGRCGIVRRQGAGGAQVHDLRGAQGRIAGRSAAMLEGWMWAMASAPILDEEVRPWFSWAVTITS